MNISVTKAAKDWGISRTTIYQKINDGKLSRTPDNKIDTSEMLRVFGEPVRQKRTEQLLNTLESTHLNSLTIQTCTDFEHQIELEKLKNEYLQQQVRDQKKLIENYQQQIDQLNKILEKANASIQDFTQVRLLEFKKIEPYDERQSEQKPNTPITNIPKKKKRWFF